MTEPEIRPRPAPSSLADVVGTVTDRQTYRNLLYAVLAFPLGVTYYVLVTFGVVLGTMLSVVLVGFGVLLGTVLGARLLARFERWLANALLDVTVRAPDDVRSTPADGPWARISAYLDASSTWRALGYLSLKFWTGVVALVVVVALSKAVTLLFVPLQYPHEVELVTVNSRPVTWTVDTLPEVLLVVPLGVVLVVAGLHVVNGFTAVAGRVALSLLGEQEP